MHNTDPASPEPPTGGQHLVRRLGVADAVVVGLGAMLGAGIFSALGPAAGAAGQWLLISLAVAGFVAYCNATSSARLAALYPRSGGTYVYGRERLGPFWGYLAGWSFIAGKTASCAAMAVTVGSYLWPDRPNVVAVAGVLAMTALSAAGVQKAAVLTRAIVVAVLLVLGLVVVVCFSAGGTDGDPATAPTTPFGVLQAAGLLFFAFAGYARIATLSEEVRDPSRTIRRAIPLALVITLAVYATVAAAVLTILGPGGLAASIDPLAQAVRVAGAPRLTTIVRAGAAVAALGALLALLLGVSRTVLAMARDRHLPRQLARVQRQGVPLAAELAVGALVAVLAATLDLRGAIGFSSFGVLLYYAIANAAALTLPAGSRRSAKLVAGLGLAGCLALCASVPARSLLAGLAVTAAGVGIFAIQRRALGGAQS